MPKATANFALSLWRQQQKTVGIAALLLLIFLLTGWKNPSFFAEASLLENAQYAGLYGIIAIAAALVMVTGGIDLSIGSVIALSAVIVPKAVVNGLKLEVGDYVLLGHPMSVSSALLLTVGVGGAIGLIHGLLITRLSLQPFLVTLCGMFMYRSIARWVAQDESWGFGTGFKDLKWLANGTWIGVPVPMWILLLLAAVMAILLHRTTFGRHLLAMGRNETAARFSGIATERIKIIAYVLCGMISAFGGFMFALKINSVLASNFGTGYELFAIAGAVLGGTSLRGGECSLAGVVLGAALVQTAQKAVLTLGVKDEWKYFVVGAIILLGVIIDEVLRRNASRRRAKERQ